MRVELLPELIREFSRDSKPIEKREVVCCDAAMDIHCEDWYVGRIVFAVVSIGVWGEGTGRAHQALVCDGHHYCRLCVMEELIIVR